MRFFKNEGFSCRHYLVDGPYLVYIADVVTANDYYPFGMTMPGRKYNSDKAVNGFNGKRKDNEIYGEGNSYDFGDRGYDPRRGQWWSIDKYAAKYPYYSPYSFAANNPISVTDIKGDSLYILFHTTGNTHNDGMFEAAALTRQTDIERSPTFDPARDKVVVLAVQDVYKVKEMVEQTVKENSPTYGQTAEVGIWSHAGPVNGPVGTVETSKFAVDKQQMTDEGWASINYNWAPNARMSFYGCRTGIIINGDNEDVPKGRASWATEISAMPNYKNVHVFGQTGSGFASKYTDFRDNAGRGNNDFILGKTPSGNTIFSRTYMVGGIRLRNNFYLPSTKALPMSGSVNGKGAVGGFQPGDKKPASAPVAPSSPNDPKNGGIM